MSELENFEKFFDTEDISYSKEEPTPGTPDTRDILGIVDLVTATYRFMFDKNGCFLALKERI